MNTDDFFEALTDIDDKFIAAAKHPIGFDEEQPVLITPAPRKPVWKTLVPIAACLAVFSIAGTFGARYFLTRPDVETSNPNTSPAEFIPEASVDPIGTNVINFQPGETPDLEEIRITTTDVQNYFSMEEFPGYSFGAFNSGIVLNGHEMNAVDVTLIDGEVMKLYLDDLNGDGARELCATVRRNGEKSVEVYDFLNSDTYSTSILSNERCGLEISDGELALMKTFHDDSGYDVDKSYPFSLDDLPLLVPGTDPMELPDTEYFGLAEFPELCFIRNGSTVYMGSNTSSTLKKPVLEGYKFYLADINGDGMRELCTYGEERTYIRVYDIANDKTYYNNASAGTWYIWLELNDGKLYTMKNEDRYMQGFHNNFRSDLKTELMHEAEKPEYEEIPLGIDQTFTLPDFEGFTFAVETQDQYRSFEINWEEGSAGEGGIDDVYLCDLDEDGQREIIIEGRYIGVSGLRVCGFMDNGEFGTVYYIENDGIRLVDMDGHLVGVFDNGETTLFEFKKSDLKPIFTWGYKVVTVSWDHTEDYSEIFPWCKSYEIAIKDRSLKINGGDNGSYNSAAQIKDIYIIPDMENDQLFIAYTDESTDRVAIVKLTEDGINCIYPDSGVALKPTDDALVLVNSETGDHVLTLPGQYDELT